MFVDDDIIEKIFELSQYHVESEEITQADIKKALIELERKLNFFSTTGLMHSHDKFNILIVDDLELSIFQFTQLLKKMGTTPNVARSKEEAMAELRKKEFNYIIVDLYLPDLNDGISLIQEMTKYKTENGQNFKIIAISSTDDEQVIQTAYSTGADEFIAKSQNWHNEVLKYLANTVSSDSENYSSFVCEDNICVYTVKHIHTEEQKNNLLQSISASIYAQKPNIVLNAERLKSFDENFTSVFSEIYKMSQNAGGEFVILSPSREIETILQNAFLSGVIKTANSINDAISLIKKN